MPDWKPHIRSRLASVRLSSSRENEIIDQMAKESLRKHLSTLVAELEK
jgi:hypothetical protein